MRLFLVCVVGLLINTPLFAGKLLIGTLAYAPPFETMADNKGNFLGFEVDLMNEICKRIQETCEYKPLAFKQLFSEIQLGSIQLAMAAITINSDKQLDYLFSLPYMASRGQLLTGTHSTISSTKDLDGKRLGIEGGSFFRTIAQKQFSKAKLVEYNTQADLFQAIANSNVDAILFDQASAKYWVNNNESLFKIVGQGIPLGIGYGIMANKSSSVLISRINKALINMENDGTYLAIYKQYFGI